MHFIHPIHYQEFCHRPYTLLLQYHERVLELALTAFFHVEVGYHPGVVDKAAQAKASARFQPRGQHTGQRNGTNQGSV